ncbi:hypothetical protein B0H12DRAFT_1122899 [Mycena haematopus]|nr:hypothetical protein B0H12DRAFT_1122899 [Mycena haematopus]
MPPKKKLKRNITDLRNQPKQPSPTQDDSPIDSDRESISGVHFDSMRVDWENEDESDIQSEVDLDEFEDEELGVNLVEMAEQEDEKDLDWLRLSTRFDRKSSRLGSSEAERPSFCFSRCI